ncbi:MAG TPA: WD40 repeat domain-containing protein [Chitinophagaceae bacterium]|nr:WD40 repeat domain-containing protein [Chitinophagaceae bacterium]
MKGKHLIVKMLLIFFFILLGLISYYQVFYKSKRVDNGIAKFDKVFTQHQQIVTSVRFTPNDSFLVTGSIDSTIKIWNRNSGIVIKEIKHPTPIAYLDLSHDGSYIVTGSYDSKVRLWKSNTGEMIKEFRGHTGTVWTVAFSKDGSKIASAGDDAVIKIWDATTGNEIQQLKGHNRIVWSVKFSPDGTKIASGSFDYTVKLWNINDGKLIWDNEEHKKTVVDLAFNNDGTLLATTSDDKTTMLWNVRTQRLIHTLKVAEHVQAVAFSPDSKRLLTGGRDKPMIGELLQNLLGDSKFNKGVSARIWDVETGELLQTFTSHANDVMDVAYSNDGKTIATASADKTVELWNIVK